jgi:hypothetical protein
MRKSHTPDVVYIIESFNEQTDSFEGRELSERVENSVYFFVETKQEFFNLWNDICCDFEERRGKMHAMPFFYFSFHGNDDGLFLQNGECVAWVEVLIFMNRFHSWLLGVPTSGDTKTWEIPRFTALCSICNSFNPIEELATKIPNPFQSWIAPRNKILPNVALDAFSTFLELCRGNEPLRSFEDALDSINLSMDTELGIKIFKKNPSTIS